MNDKIIARWLWVYLLNMVLAGVLGAILRLAFVTQLSWMEFTNVLHAHSHVAILGGVYSGLFVLLIKNFLPVSSINISRYNRIFYALQVMILSMMVAFFLQGYALWSIIFSTIHISVFYYFVFQFLKDYRRHETGKPTSRIFLIVAFGFMLFSTLGIWSIIPLILNDLKGSSWYHMSVQFYLHFQFGGWFLFSVFALMFKKLEDGGGTFFPKTVRSFLGLMVVSTLLTYALAVSWSNPHHIVYAINGIGVLVGIVGVFYFLRIFKRPIFLEHPGNHFLSTIFLRSAIFYFVVKILMQATHVVPKMASISLTVRNFTIGFLHLILLGVVTHYIIGRASGKGMLQWGTGFQRMSGILFFISFILSEFLLFFQGFLLWMGQGFVPGYYVLIFSFSFGMLLGLVGMLMSQRQLLKKC